MINDFSCNNFIVRSLFCTFTATLEDGSMEVCVLSSLQIFWNSMCTDECTYYSQIII
ncbi:hypothetical protein CAXC1_300032 [Candidatus Xenohaliotis californiensis]|uniref:Uncharacterized protein n=1 Tax=Candidatus Xenohaliotis californiensis TaxID=84677 RepID=A0ABP0ESZ3_9RICK|nr:hypothetical protein CAXC1_300032 [Candidatus Xenohaliotis californiensis]